MGQRFQIIIRTPEEYWNEDNVNNVKERTFVYHSQFCWGYFAVWRMGELIYAIKKLIKLHPSESYPIKYSDLIPKAINWVNYNHIENMQNINPYFDKAELNKEELKEFEEAPKKFLNTLDNNNGQFILIINNKMKLSYCFYNPIDSYTECKAENKDKVLDYKEYLIDYKNDHSDISKTKYYKKAVKQFEKIRTLKDLEGPNFIFFVN